MVPLLLTAFLSGEILLRVSPEPLSVTRLRYGPVSEMGTHRVLACNEGEELVSLDAGRVEMAIEHLSIIEPDAALEVLATRGNERARVRIGKVLRVLAEGATAAAAAGYLGVDGQTAGLIGLGISFADRIRGRIEQKVIVFDRSKMLTGMIEIEAGRCISRVVFAGLIPRSQLRPREYMIQVNDRRRLLVEGISSVKGDF